MDTAAETMERGELGMYERVEGYASLQFSAQEVAIILDRPDTFFDDDPKAFAAYMRGRLRAQAEVREAILNEARGGSNPAQREFQKLAEASEPVVENG